MAQQTQGQVLEQIKQLAADSKQAANKAAVLAAIAKLKASK